VRKRLIIGAATAVVIGVVAYFLSKPKQGTVEWHKSQYLKTLERVSQNTWKDKLKRAYRRVAGRPQPLPWSSETLASDLLHHRDSLIRLGYLKKTRISLTSTDPETATRAGWLSGRDTGDVLRRFIVITIDGSKVLEVIAPPSELPKIEAAIRKADDGARHSNISEGALGDALVPNIK
jgi:hypothetical protein